MTTEPTTSPSGETPEGTSPQAGETPTTPPSGETSGSSSDDTQKELDRLAKALSRANAEAKKHREKAEELDRLKAEIETSKLSEQEKLQKQLADLQKAHDKAVKDAAAVRLSAEIRDQARDLNIPPDLAAKLIDRDALEFDSTGNPTNVADTLKALIKDYPVLAGGKATQSVPTGGGATNPSKSQSSAPVALTRESIAEMASKRPEEYTARRAEIQAWLAAHPWRYGQS